MTKRRRFYDLEAFPAFSDVTAHWRIIREEVIGLTAPVLKIDRVNKSHEDVYKEVLAGGRNGWVYGGSTDDHPNEKWLNYAVRIYDAMVFNTREILPETSRFIEALEGIRVCAFNKLLPDSFLGTHDHPGHRKRGTLLYHLALDMEEEGQPFNYVNVDGEFKNLLPGTAYVFDGSLPHFALNASSRERLILYIEFYKDKIAKKPTTPGTSDPIIS